MPPITPMALNSLAPLSLRGEPADAVARKRTIVVTEDASCCAGCEGMLCIRLRLDHKVHPVSQPLGYATEWIKCVDFTLSHR